MNALILIALVAIQAEPPSSRELQWVYRDRHGDGRVRPTAVFLSWDYSSVIFHASCSEEEADTLQLRYFPGPLIGGRDRDGHLQMHPVPPIRLRRGERSATLPTGLLWNSIVGRIRITPALLELLRPSPDTGLEIDAINEMEEEWQTGEAEPLYRLASACDDAER